MRGGRCASCGARTTGRPYCQTCKWAIYNALKRVKKEGLIVDQAGGSWWIWDRDGEILVTGKATEGQALAALSLGEEHFLEDDYG